jgi:thiamine kinase-like enzyme
LDPEELVKLNFNSRVFHVTDQSGVKSLSNVNEGLVLINMTNVPAHQYPVQHKAVEGILSFAAKGEVFGNYTTDRYYFIRNDIETFRWVFPNDLKYPFFLRYYDQNAAYGNLFKGFCCLAGLFRQMRWLADGHFTVIHPSASSSDFLSILGEESFTLFTNDFFNTGIALLQLISNQSIKSYAKVPFSQKGEGFINHEHQVLQKLSDYEFRHIRIPEASRETGLLKLSNVMKLRHRYFPKFTKYHFRGLGEYTRTFAHQVKLETFLKQEEVMEKLDYLKQALQNEEVPEGLGPSNTAQLYQQLVHILNNLPLDHEITLSLVHGDFTEENLSIEEEQLVMVDWEEAHFDWPALGDVMTFLNFRMEEEGPPSLESFQDEWQRLLKHEAFRVLVAEFAPQPMLHFKVFWFIKALTYIRAALDEGSLPYYLNWRIYCWRNVLEAYQEEAEWLQVPAPKASANLN